MDKKIETYLEELTKCRISTDEKAVPNDAVLINGQTLHEYNEDMAAKYDEYRIALLTSVNSLQAPDFVKMSKMLEKCNNNIRDLEVGCALGKTHFLRMVLDDYTKLVKKSASLIEDVKLFMLAHPVAPSISPEEPQQLQQEAITEEKKEEVPIEEEIKEPRRSFNDKNTSHPGEYWGFKEMEQGEGISHSTACKISKDPDLQSAFRYVGRAIRVDIAKLHELQRKKTAEKNKPIGKNPRNNKKTPTL